MARDRKNGSIRILLLAGFSLSMIQPIWGSEAVAAKMSAAAKKGTLNKAQEKAFKDRKVAATKQKKAADAIVKQETPALKRDQRELNRASYAANNSRKNLNKYKSALDKAISDDRLMSDVLGQPYTPGKRIVRMQKLYDLSEAFHKNGPKAQYDAAAASVNNRTDRLKNATKDLKNATDALAIRKWEKGAARAANLQLASDKKVQNVQKRPRPVAYAQLPRPAIIYERLPPRPVVMGKIPPPPIIYAKLPDANNPRTGITNVEQIPGLKEFSAANIRKQADIHRARVL